MAIRIPSNITVKSQYTAGKQYMYESTQREYQGYYYEMNGKIFAGKEFNSNAPTLLKITPNNINSLLATAATYVYGKITGTKISTEKPSSYIYNPSVGAKTRYFCSQVNVSPTVIKEIDESTYKSFSKNPLYKVVALPYNGDFDDASLDKAEKIIPGIKTFVRDSFYSESLDFYPI